MTDVFNKQKRSEIMSKIRSKNTRPEKFLYHLFNRLSLKVVRHPKIYGSPDFYLPELHSAIFLDGCFWHGCKKHLRLPKSNSKYWRLKIKKNMARDRKINHHLKKKGYKIVRIWEHDIKF